MTFAPSSTGPARRRLRCSAQARADRSARSSPLRTQNGTQALILYGHTLPGPFERPTTRSARLSSSGTRMCARFASAGASATTSSSRHEIRSGPRPTTSSWTGTSSVSGSVRVPARLSPSSEAMARLTFAMSSRRFACRHSFSTETGTAISRSTSQGGSLGLGRWSWRGTIGASSSATRPLR